METCLNCHNRKEFTRANVHGALEEGCTICHDVHDNNTKELRTLAVNAVCDGCHDSAKMHAHPLGKGFIDPRTNRAMTCLSCHAPHSSDFEHILTLDHRRDLCVQCHAPGTMRVR